MCSSFSVHSISALDGKCFYRNDGWWTYEFCYKSHIKQMRIDPHLDKVVEERVVGVYSPWSPFELHHNPDRMDHTDNLHEVGPAWTTALTTGVCLSSWLSLYIHTKYTRTRLQFTVTGRSVNLEVGGTHVIGSVRKLR